MNYALNFHWLAKTGDIRTRPKITIPYNPQIIQWFLRSKKTFNAFHKAKHYQKLIQNKALNSKAELARRDGLTRTRIWQILSRLKLAPEIQEFLGSLTDDNLIMFFTEKRLRKIATIKDHETQLKKFQELKKKANTAPSLIKRIRN